MTIYLMVTHVGESGKYYSIRQFDRAFEEATKGFVFQISEVCGGEHDPVDRLNERAREESRRRGITRVVGLDD